MTEQNFETELLDVNLLDEFADHPFKFYKGTRFDGMVASIRESGIHNPLIVRPKENGRYEILAGHNRHRAAIEAGLSAVPCIIKHDITDDEARLVVTETNFNQRSFADFLPSERAKAIVMYNEAFDALVKQGKRTDTKSGLDAEKADNEAENLNVGRNAPLGVKRNRAAVEFGLDPRNISRYARLIFLTPEWLDAVDDRKIAVEPANDISFLSADNQKTLLAVVERNDIRINLRFAKELKDRFKDSDESLDEEEVLEIYGGKGKNKKSSRFEQIGLSSKIFRSYFTPNESPKKVRNTIEQALKFFFEAKERGDVAVDDIESAENDE